ncbi:PREDICTED: uncharacterized protein LOC107356592 [Paramuricea clavata]|uniref:PREDICTED: uncharacterized protein LOC107356592 n=1 Tax=Paramuricea clavata TaxID=317549 RepID=A0A7D9DV54_PARCT|nr:PREDICTED: uncharacterized protein LOC107356592 [Paramuricea clavata]
MILCAWRITYSIRNLLVEKNSLQAAGLGRKTLTFGRTDDALAFVSKIETVYPKIKTGGGFELLRSGASNKEIILITPPPSGYTVPFLRESSGIGQALIYVRPIQKSLQTDPAPLFQDLASSSTECPRVQCISCSTLLPVTEVRSHQLICGGQDDGENEDSEENSHYTDQREEASEQQTDRRTKDGTSTHTNTAIAQSDADMSTSSSSDISVLQEICPNADPHQILISLRQNNRNLDLTAQEILGIPSDPIDGDFGNENDDECLINFSMFQSTPEKMGNVSKKLDPMAALETFRKENTDVNSAREQFYISRLEGIEDMKRDILGLYKDPRKNLKACPKVRFEGEEGVGAGPVREFFVCALGIAREGMSGTGRPVVYFEGEADHLLPVHNQMLQQMGAFVCIGKMIGHSILHGGPGLFGVSSAAKHFWAYNVDENPPLLVLDDIADINLRELIHEVCS